MITTATLHKLEDEIERIARFPQPEDEESTWSPATSPGGPEGLQLCAQLRGALLQTDPKTLEKDPGFLTEYQRRKTIGNKRVEELTTIAKEIQG